MNLAAIREHQYRRVSNAVREAAVLVPVLRDEGDPWLLFTKRADHLGEHPGQMSFPGGGREPIDTDLEATSLREAHEEIGLRPEEVTVIGRLDDIRTTSEYAVSPFVAEIPVREYKPDRREVAEIVRLRVADLTEPANYEYERRDHPVYGDIIVHYFHIGDYTVWGATGRIVVQFLELSTDWNAPERLDPEQYG